MILMRTLLAGSLVATLMAGVGTGQNQTFDIRVLPV
jgi:hypothetical protein